MKRFILFFSISFFTLFSFSQSNRIDALKNDYPILMGKLETEFLQQNVDYIFVVDISGSMHSFSSIVVPSLKTFITSLPDGDYVSLIKFGSEAANDFGSFGAINEDMKLSLCNYADKLYDIPNSDLERFCHWTDLDNMLHYLADDMQKIGRNDLKFVFIITDFEHNSCPARVGKEKWEKVKNRFALEQKNNNITVFGLQLNAGNTDLDTVKQTFPESFHFTSVPISSNAALSAWFADRINKINLDKFKSLVQKKMFIENFCSSAQLSISGDLTLNISWKKNQLFENLTIEKIKFNQSNFTFISKLPQNLNIEEDKFDAGKFINKSSSFFTPTFSQFNDKITVYTSFDPSINDELNRLGFNDFQLESTIELDKSIFSHPLSLTLFIILLTIILIYFFLVFAAIKRNGKCKINGKFRVEKNGLEIENKTANKLNSLTIGKNGKFIALEDCMWIFEISVKTYFPFILKKPCYQVKVKGASEFKINTKKYKSSSSPIVQNNARVEVGEFQIKWSK